MAIHHIPTNQQTPPPYAADIITPAVTRKTDANVIHVNLIEAAAAALEKSVAFSHKSV
jgi:hypothetical protein